MTCPSLMHKTNHDYRTDLFEPSGWPGTRPWKSWWQASFWLFPVCLAARKKGAWNSKKYLEESSTETVFQKVTGIFQPPQYHKKAFQ